jgi:threonine dehydratase
MHEAQYVLTPTALAYARTVVGRHVRPTPTYRWPLLERATGTETWVKHENHTPTGAFKVRGGLNFVERMRVSRMAPAGLISATRGNHGQSMAFAGRANGLRVTIVVPEGNSPDKNAAMEAFGADLVVRGRDFQDAREYAAELAAERNLLFVPSFHPWLVEGVATYAAEMHEAVPGLDVVYVPIGLGSGIVANIAVRDLFGLRTEIVGVVAAKAPAYALSFEAGRPTPTDDADTLADGVAVRTPDPDAVARINRGVSRIVQVSEEQALEAVALSYRATHNLPEPAGSIALAGLLADADRPPGKRVAIVQTGGNCDFDLLQRALS